MRFNTPAEVKDWARKVAAEDLKRHEPIHTDPDGQQWQIDKNPYCTQGARHDWQRGYNNEPPRTYDHPDANAWSTQYQRGRAMAELMEPTKCKLN